MDLEYVTVGGQRYVVSAANIEVLAARVQSAEADLHRQTERAYAAELLAQAAVSCLTHNKARLARPRGEDERRLIESLGATDMGPFWSGGTDGWLYPPAAQTSPPADPHHHQETLL
jgi:hypothetical protein